MPKSYPTEFKIKTIRRYEKGESLKGLSKNYMFPKALSISGTISIIQSKHQNGAIRPKSHYFKAFKGNHTRF